MSLMDYSKAKDWIVREKDFDSNLLGKCEAIMCLGNGYMGLRSSTEERYLKETRDLFVSGTFNKFDDSEVTELPNAADVVAMDISLNGESFSLDKGTVEKYERELNIKTGELIRNIIWISPKNEKYVLSFQRIVSKKNLHLIAQKINISSETNDFKLTIKTGINGRMTNNGSQHFSEGDKRLFDKKFMQYTQTTSQSKIDFVFTTGVKFDCDNVSMGPVDSRIVMDRRTIEMEYSCEVKSGRELSIEKITDVRTSRDKEAEDLSLAELRDAGLKACKKAFEDGYKESANESAREWKKSVWDQNPITIHSNNEMDQLAIRFAQYHLNVMTPAHDHRMNIGAKGLSGEGYKGHTFWDTDIFALPYFTFSKPEVARKLEEYRYLSLPGAHKKAKENGYEGAQFPWESAWLDDGEVTPVWGAADIVTGLPTKIWSGFIEQHITSDVAYGIWQYYMVSGDQEFMDLYGYELMMDTAKFWVTRLEYSEKDKMYHINDVVGPDEYKEHVNDNAFTNYMACWNIEKAIYYHDLLRETKPELFAFLNEKLQLDQIYPLWVDRKEKIYKPVPNENLLVAQDSTYLSLKNIDLTKYKNQEQVGSLFQDYNLEQVNQIQVSKQADIMVLFFLMEDLFSPEVKKANWDYYEPRTLHDSSLSLSTHTILACDMGEDELAYSLFERAREIDLGNNMKSSNDGIHAASIAGIWQSIVFGFGGTRMLNGKLRINPCLPKEWDGFEYNIYWQGERLKVSIDTKQMMITNETQTKEISFEHNGENYKFTKSISLEL